MGTQIWEVQTGKKLHDFPHTGSVRCVEWNEGGTMFVSVSDPFRGAAATVAVYEFSGADVDAQPQEPKYVWEIPGLEQGKKSTNVTWMPLNKNIMSTDEFGVMRIHEVS